MWGSKTSDRELRAKMKVLEVGVGFLSQVTAASSTCRC